MHKREKEPLCAPGFQSVSFKTSEVYIIREPLTDSDLYPIETESVNAKHFLKNNELVFDIPIFQYSFDIPI